MKRPSTGFGLLFFFTVHAGETVERGERKLEKWERWRGSAIRKSAPGVAV